MQLKKIIILGVLVLMAGTAISIAAETKYQIFIQNKSSYDVMISYLNAPTQKFPAEKNDFTLYANKSFHIGDNKTHKEKMTINVNNGTCLVTIFSRTESGTVSKLYMRSSPYKCGPITISNADSFTSGGLGKGGDGGASTSGSLAGDFDVAATGGWLKLSISD